MNAVFLFWYYLRGFSGGKSTITVAIYWPVVRALDDGTVGGMDERQGQQEYSAVLSTSSHMTADELCCNYMPRKRTNFNSCIKITLN
jgi:hypothetical protein